MHRSPEARSLVGFPVNQEGASQLTGATPAPASIRNRSSNWTGLSYPESMSTDTVKLGGLESGLATTPKNHSSLIRLIVVRPLSLLGSVRRHERLPTRHADIDDIPLVGKESSIGSIILKIKLVRRIAGRSANSPLLVPQQVRGKRRSGDDCIGFVLRADSPSVMRFDRPHSYGAERQVTPQHKATWKIIPWDLSNPRSYVTFVFRYRSVGAYQPLLARLVNLRPHNPPPITEWLTSEGIIPTPDAPVIQTPDPIPAVPPTPELSDVSTPANTTSTVPTPSDRGKKRSRREVVSRFVLESWRDC